MWIVPDSRSDLRPIPFIKYNIHYGKVIYVILLTIFEQLSAALPNRFTVSKVLQEIRDIMIVRIITKDLSLVDDINSPQTQNYNPGLLQMSARYLANIMTTLNYNPNLQQVPFVPTDLNPPISKRALNSIVGISYVDTFTYVKSFNKNLFRHVDLRTRLRPRSIYVDLVIIIIKALSICGAIKYLEKLWHDVWIHDIETYSQLWVTVNMYEIYLKDSLPLEHFRSILLTGIRPDIYRNFDPKPLFLKLKLMFEHTKITLSNLREYSISMSDWLRGLYEIWATYCNMIELSKIILSMNTDEEINDYTRKMRRHAEENRVDIFTTITNPLIFIPLTYSDFNFDPEEIGAPDKYFKFQFKGRISIPRIHYEVFFELLLKNRSIINTFEFFSKLYHIVRSDLSKEFLKAYESLYENNLTEIERYFSSKRNIMSEKKYLELQEAGKAIAYFLISQLKNTYVLDLDFNEISTALMLSDSNLVLSYLKNNLHAIKVEPIGVDSEFTCENEDATQKIAQKQIEIFCDIVDGLKVAADVGIRSNTVRFIEIGFPRKDCSVTFEINGDELHGMYVPDMNMLSKVDIKRIESYLQLIKNKEFIKISTNWKLYLPHTERKRHEFY